MANTHELVVNYIEIFFCNWIVKKAFDILRLVQKQSWRFLIDIQILFSLGFTKLVLIGLNLDLNFWVLLFYR